MQYGVNKAVRKFPFILAFLGLAAACAPQNQYGQTGTSVYEDYSDSMVREQQRKKSRFDKRDLQSSVPDEYAKKAETAMKRNLKDPQSAQFRHDFISESSSNIAVCGAVNAKNSYGGYVGYKRFYAVLNQDQKTVQETGIQGSINDMIAYCGFTDPDNESRSEAEP